MPPWLPWHYPLVLLSGVAEVIVGILLLMPPHTLAGSMADYSFITRYFSRVRPPPKSVAIAPGATAFALILRGPSSFAI